MSNVHEQVVVLRSDAVTICCDSVRCCREEKEDGG